VKTILAILVLLAVGFCVTSAVFIDEASLHQFANGVDPSVHSQQNRAGGGVVADFVDAPPILIT
jgi:hypothetical protein